MKWFVVLVMLLLFGVMGGSGDDRAAGVVLDKKDNLYVVGDYKESPTFAHHKPAAGPGALTITFGRLFLWQLLYPKP